MEGENSEHTPNGYRKCLATVLRFSPGRPGFLATERYIVSSLCCGSDVKKIRKRGRRRFVEKYSTAYCCVLHFDYESFAILAISIVITSPSWCILTD
jgi:hypothetical protein